MVLSRVGISFRQIKAFDLQPLRIELRPSWRIPPPIHYACIADEAASWLTKCHYKRHHPAVVVTRDILHILSLSLSAAFMSFFRAAAFLRKKPPRINSFIMSEFPGKKVMSKKKLRRKRALEALVTTGPHPKWGVNNDRYCTHPAIFTASTTWKLLNNVLK